MLLIIYFWPFVCSQICDSKLKRTSLPDGIGGTDVPLTAIKLFGKTLMVAEVEKPVAQDINKGKENSTIEDDSKFDGPSPLNENQDTRLFLGKNGPVPFSSVQFSPDGPLQRWPLYQSPPFIYFAPCNPPPVQEPTGEKEKSCSGSNITNSMNEAETGARNLDSVDSKCRNKLCQSRKVQKGFVPYKRCATKSEEKPGEATSLDERQAQRARVC